MYRSPDCPIHQFFDCSGSGELEVFKNLAKRSYISLGLAITRQKYKSFERMCLYHILVYLYLNVFLQTKIQYPKINSTDKSL